MLNRTAVRRASGTTRRLRSRIESIWSERALMQFDMRFGAARDQAGEGVEGDL